MRIDDSADMPTALPKTARKERNCRDQLDWRQVHHIGGRPDGLTFQVIIESA
jgi:hypothetical protein